MPASGKRVCPTRVRETATVAGPRALSLSHVRGKGRVARAALGVLVPGPAGPASRRRPTTRLLPAINTGTSILVYYAVVGTGMPVRIRCLVYTGTVTVLS